MTHAHDLLAAAWALRWWIGGFYLACAIHVFQVWARDAWHAHQQRRAGLAPWKAFEAAEHAIEADRDAVLHVVFPRQRGGGWL